MQDTAIVPTFSMTPRTFDEALKFAELMSKSDLVPKDFKDKPGNILVAIQKGQEVGLSPMAALETIAVINGRASLWGDGLLGIVQGSAVYEWIDESQCSEKAGICMVKRKGEQPYTATFTLEDAKRAGLLGKAGPWTQYTKRMLQLRARGFALRDKFADVLKGLVAAEEAMDTVTILPADSGQPAPSSLKDKLKAQLPAPDEPKQPATMVQPARQEDGGGDAFKAASMEPRATPQETTDAPAPSAADYCKQRAAEADDLFIDGFITNLQPYSGTKRNEKGKRPGQFDVDDGAENILLKWVKYFDPEMDITSGLKRVHYKTSTYNGKTQYEALTIEALE